MTENALPILVAALYRFTPFDDLEGLRGELCALCDAHGVKGTLLLAAEGINGTIAGTPESIEATLARLRALPGCKTRLSVKLSRAAAMPFYRMKVRLKREIVTMGVNGVDAARDAGTYVPAEAWNALIADPDTILIDTRNDYEVRIGSFEGAINPNTRSFRDFPAWFRANRESLLADKAQPKVAMYCTGGIRCEKATAFLKAEGVEEVFHLDGGILKYLEAQAEPTSLWRGECFVFDQRVALGHGLAPGTHVLCRACRMPVTVEEQASPLYEEGVSCPGCHGTRDAAQREGYAERQRQVARAAKRGLDHFASGPAPAFTTSGTKPRAAAPARMPPPRS